MTRIAINGYGRIGRSLLRALYERGLLQTLGSDLTLSAINELADAKTLAYLTRFDSTHGRFPATVLVREETLWVDDVPIQLSHQADAHTLDWRAKGIDLVLECSGTLNSREAAARHLAAGAQRVLLSQPADKSVDATVIMGVNQDVLASSDLIVSAGSCTTNASLPVLKTIHAHNPIESGAIRTLHAAMNDQPVIDAYHHTDLRKTRSAFESMIPVDTALAAGIERVMPELTGKLQASAIRVPISNVSALDICLQLQRPTSEDEINQWLTQAAAGPLHGVLNVSDEPMVSCDFVHDRHSGVIDAAQTQVAGGNLVKLLVWFDNEWGFANRMVDIAQHWIGTRKR